MRSSLRHSTRRVRVGTDADAVALSGAAVDFANTVACEACRTSDGLASPETFARWNRAHASLPYLPAPDEVLSELRVLRRDLRETFESHVQGIPPGAALLRRLNRWFGRSPTHLRASYSMGRWRFEEVREVARPVRRWESDVAHAAASLLAGPLSQKLRKCQAPGCAHYLVSRRKGQLWCSPTGCGNRVRVARHYRKRRGPRVREQADRGRVGSPPPTPARSSRRGAAPRTMRGTARVRRSSGPA